MTQEQWRRVDNLFEELVDLDDAVRAERLATVEPELRERLERLLRADDANQGAIARIVENSSRPAQTLDFGPWRAVELIGQGGMGIVYKAVRADGSFAKDVAIKLLQLGMERAETRERFRQERQILAGLDHPSIAHLLDGGETEDGSPYIVLEYVDGRDILDFAKDLGLAAKLRLFLEVCDAVQHAHQKLIVHRDLKPSNILVTAQGKVKLLDFGIAKMLEVEQERTATGFQALTPNYASPEQVTGAAISVAADVYSLGVVLYQLLTGRLPYQIASHSPLDLHRAICETAPEQPGLGEDLDNILAMALRKEPERRYPSMQQFGDDIRRYLDDRPVLARPDTLRYRSAKFVRRNLVSIGAALSIVVALTGGVIVSQYQARQAERRFGQVRRLANRFLFEFDAEIQPLAGSTKARQMVVNTALEYLDSLAQDAQSDLGLQAEIAAAYDRVGDVQGSPSAPSLGLTEAALTSYARSKQLWTKVLAASPRDVQAMKALAQACLKSGDLQLRAQQQDQAERNFAQGSAIAAAAQQLAPIDPDIAFLVAGAWLRLGDLRRERDEDARSLEAFEKALEGYREALRLQPSDRYRQAVAISIIRVARNHLESNEPRKALEYQLEAVRLRQSLAAASPNNAAMRRGLALTYNATADIHGAPEIISLDDWRTAADYYQKSLAILRHLVAADTNDTTVRTDLLLTLMKLGDVQLRKEAKLAKSTFEEALQTGATLETAKERSDTQRLIARVWAGLGSAQFLLGDKAQARVSLTKAIARMDQRSSRGDKLRALTVLGDIYQSLGQRELARATWMQANAAPVEGDLGLAELRDRGVLATRLQDCTSLRQVAEDWRKRTSTIPLPFDPRGACPAK